MRAEPLSGEAGRSSVRSRGGDHGGKGAAFSDQAERPGVCAWRDRSFALASETMNVKGKPVEICNVAQLDSSGPAAASGAVQAGDYERLQRDSSHSCT